MISARVHFLWVSAFSLILITWPDFAKEELEAAIREYHGRRRRIGRVLEAG